jgi:hypothetical protein
MNIQHLQETARHYANLAEQYRTELAEEQQLNEDLLGLVDALCEELGIDVEALFEDLQTDARSAELAGEIARTTGPRKSRLIKKDVKEKESDQVVDLGGRVRRRVGRQTSLGPAGYDNRDDIRAPRPFDDHWRPQPTDIADASDAGTEKKIADKQAAEAAATRRATGMKPRSGLTAAQKAARGRVAALKRGLETAKEEQQEKDTGIQPSLGKRVRRAVASMTGNSKMPSDHTVLSRRDAERAARAEGRKETRRTTTGEDQRNW